MSWYLDHNILNEYNINLMDADDLAWDLKNEIFENTITEEEKDLAQDFLDMFYEGWTEQEKAYKLKPALQKALIENVKRKKEQDEAPQYELD
jgi:hypothetical protein